MKLTEGTLKEMVEGILPDPSLFLVAIKSSDSGERGKIKIILDGDRGISIDQCAEVSRKLGALLDENDAIANSYVLEVTSPGVDHPLQLIRQYVKNVGRRVKVILKDNTETRGILKGVQKEFIEVEAESKIKPKKKTKTEIVEIPFSKIDKTKIQISFK